MTCLCGFWARTLQMLRANVLHRDSANATLTESLGPNTTDEDSTTQSNPFFGTKYDAPGQIPAEQPVLQESSRENGRTKAERPASKSKQSARNAQDPERQVGPCKEVAGMSENAIACGRGAKHGISSEGICTETTAPAADSSQFPSDNSTDEKRKGKKRKKQSAAMERSQLEPSIPNIGQGLKAGKGVVENLEKRAASQLADGRHRDGGKEKKKQRQNQEQSAEAELATNSEHITLSSQAPLGKYEAGSREGSDAEIGKTDDLELRTIFVGNVPPGTKGKSLKSIFRRFGSIETVRLRSFAADPESKMPKSLQVKAGKTNSNQNSINAYICFSSLDAAQAALQMNMTELDGMHIRVDMASSPGKKSGSVQYDPKRSVFVGNLPRDVNEEDLITIFNSGEEQPALHSSVEGVRIVRDKYTRVGKGIAYVLLKTKVAALAALQLNGKDCGGREMRITRVHNPSHQEAATKRFKTESRKEKSSTDFQGRSYKGRKSVEAATVRGSAKTTAKFNGVEKKRTHKRPAVAQRKAKAKAMQK